MSSAPDTGLAQGNHRKRSESTRCAPGTVPHTSAYSVFHPNTQVGSQEVFSSWLHITRASWVGFLASSDHRVLICKVGNDNRDRGEGEDEVLSPAFGSGPSRPSGEGSHYKDLIALGAKSLGF